MQMILYSSLYVVHGMGADSSHWISSGRISDRDVVSLLSRFCLNIVKLGKQ